MVSIGFVLALWSGSRALNVFVDTITIMYGLGGHRGIVRTRALSFLLYVLGMITGVVTIPLVVAGPTLVAQVAAATGSAFLNQLYWPIVLRARHLLPGHALPRVGAGPDGLALQPPGRRVHHVLLGLRLGAAALGAGRYGAGLDLDLRPAGGADRVLLWLYLLSIAVLIGAALNAAFDQIWPQKELTSARLELLKRLKLENVLPWRASPERARRTTGRTASRDEPSQSRTTPPAERRDNPVRAAAAATYIAVMTEALP